MEKLKLFVNDYKKIIIASAYALAITLMTSLLLEWSKIFAFMLVFIVVLELTYTIFHALDYEENKEDKDSM